MVRLAAPPNPCRSCCLPCSSFAAGLCALGAAFCWFLYPETAGLSLEETREVFSESFGIKKANRLRKEKEAALRQLRGIA